MLSKKYRIDTNLFDEIFKNGKTYHSDFLYLKVLSIKGESRFAFVITKKNIPGAIKRNLMKRRGYSSVKKFLPSIKPGLAIIFFLKKDSDKMTFSDFSKEIEKSLSEANFI